MRPANFATTFDRARRKAAYARLSRIVRGHDPETLPSLDDARRRLRAFSQRYIGLRPIRVDQIVGSVNRTVDFDREWRPLRPGLKERWRRLEQVFDEGDFPPITVYELGGGYFVADGHHRVAIAKQRGVEYIDAEVTKLRTRTRLPVGADVGRVILAEQERLFMEESGLAVARPEALIEFTRPSSYLELLDLVRVHGYKSCLKENRVLAPANVAEIWYDTVYLPAVQAIRAQNLRRYFPGSTEADLFLAVHHRRLHLVTERGRISFADAAEATLQKEQGKRPTRRLRRALDEVIETNLTRR
ncbi:MAG: ParB/RepB/Spo0J family partition protein [Candidatus Dormibacteraeota bacterium]|nr:ParB/RepB/Spo0J family partition protein [Candidatus Dormibacteraeota bacterium]